MRSLTPAFSPDNQWLAFSCLRDNSFDLEVVAVAGGEPRRLIRVNDIPAPLAWTADNSRILYTERNRLFAINRDGGASEQLPFASSASQPAVALRGDRLAYVEWTKNTNLWRFNLRSHKPDATSPLLTSSRIQRAPDISPDGKKIAFESERQGRHDVWVANLDGSEAEEMGHFQTMTGSPRWSPDGRYVAFDSRENGRASLYLVDPQVGIPRRVDTGGVAAQVPRWSRDGKWIYFSAISPKSAFLELFKVHPEGGKPQLVTSTTAISGQEDRTGHQLYFMAGEVDAPIHVLDLSTGIEHELAGMPRVDTPTDWVVAAGGIYFVDPASRPAALNYFDFASHRVTRRGALPKQPEFWGGLALAPDESWLAYSQVDRNDSDLMLAEPFR